MYLKELDERGWVVYSNWGSKAGKGGQVFGSETDGTGFSQVEGDTDAEITAGGDIQDDDDLFGTQQRGNRWVALTFHWPIVERQVRIEGLVESLSREESETYWRTRERGSQVGAWSSQQSKILWSTATQHRQTSSDGDGPGAEDDGRALLDKRVQDMENRFASADEIPLPPFWGGIRIVPESVEFWQGRKSRLHDRFRYVRVHEGNDGEKSEKTFKWNIQRLSP